MLSAVSFFFSSRRRHTRFDCDWSSDVCSSDLPELFRLDRRHWRRRRMRRDRFDVFTAKLKNFFRRYVAHDNHYRVARRIARSEERRVGKECRSRWSPDHLKKKKKSADTLSSSL